MLKGSHVSYYVNVGQIIAIAGTVYIVSKALTLEYKRLGVTVDDEDNKTIPFVGKDGPSFSIKDILDRFGFGFGFYRKH